MDDSRISNAPLVVSEILRDTDALGFRMASDAQTGSLLRCLAASKPGGRMLELGTGTGVGTAWLLSGMDALATLDTVESDEAVQGIARKHLGNDKRVTFHLVDGAEFLCRQRKHLYDLVFADTWPGKFHYLDVALSQLAPGGIYVVDDLLPQASWPEGHGEKIGPLIAALERNEELCCTRLCWSTGIMLAVKKY